MSRPIWYMWCVCTYSLTLSFVQSQGTVWFRNKIGTTVDAPFFDDRGVRLEGPSYVAQLYAWKTGEGFSAVGAPLTFSTNGYFFGDSVGVPFVQGCLPVWVQVRAWQVSAAATFEQAALAGAWTGLSSVLFIPLTGDPGRPESCIEARLIGLQYPGSPMVFQQPKGQTVLAGTSATLSVIASSGVRMAYQWYQDGGDRPDGLIVGATNATYITPPLSTNATYWASITNSAGSVFSDKVTITVVPAAPRLTLEQVAGLPLLRLDGSVGINYRIEYSTNLTATNWRSLVELSLQTTSFTFIDAGIENSSTRFYRVVAP